MQSVSSKKKAKVINDLGVHTASTERDTRYYNDIRSPQPGPSHMSSQQTVGGTSPTDQTQLSYQFEIVAEKTFKNGVKDRHFRVKFNPDQSLDGRNP